MPDAKAALKVFRRQLELDRYSNSLPRTIPEIADYCAVDRDGGRKVDLAGVIVKDKNGVYRYTHKKVRGVAVADDTSYGEWVMSKDFPTQTHRVLRAILDEIYAARDAEVEQGQGALL